MKKALIVLLTTVLILSTFISCSPNNDDMFLSIVHASKKSTYNCLSYVGAYNNQHFIRTKSDGIIYFSLDENLNAKEVKNVEFGEVSSIRGAYIYGSSLYAINSNGDLLVKDLSKEDSKPALLKSNYYKSLNKNGTLVADKSGKVEKLPNSTIVTITDVASSSDIKKVFETGKYDYAISNDSLYLISDTSISEINLNGKNTKDIVNITTGENGTTYIVFSNLEIHAIDSGKINASAEADSKLLFSPTASFAYGKYIAYKTTDNIELFDTETKKITHNYKEGWAEDLYTSSTSISEFVKVGAIYFSINDNGGIYRIDTSAGTASSIFNE